MVREVRKYGVAVRVATQRLSDLPDECLANFARLIVMKLSSPQDLSKLKSYGEHFTLIAQNLERGEGFNLKDPKAQTEIKIIKFHRFTAPKPRFTLPPRKVEVSQPSVIKAEVGPTSSPKVLKIVEELERAGAVDDLLKFSERRVCGAKFKVLINMGSIKRVHDTYKLTRLGEEVVDYLKKSNSSNT